MIINFLKNILSKMYMHPIKHLSGANELHLYYQHDKYYVIGTNDAPNCTQLFNYDCNKVGNSCVNVTALLGDWLTYNNYYNLTTTLYIDTNIIFPSSPKYEPNCKIVTPNHHYANTLSKLNNLKLKNKLLSYYEDLGNFLFNQQMLPSYDNDIMEHVQLPDMPNYFKYMDIIGPFAKTLYFDQLTTIKGLKYASFQSFALYANKLFTILNVIELISRMMMNGSDTHIIYTQNTNYFTAFFSWMHYEDVLNVKGNNNCIAGVPKALPADDIRWVVHRTDMSKSNIVVDYVKNFNLNTKVIRAGVLLYTYENGQLYIGFGIDRVYDEYTDFGGKVETRDKDAIYAALRELNEESNGLYQFTPNDVQKNLILYNNKTVIIFIYVDMNTSKQFKATAKDELKGIIWLTEDELKKELKRPHSKIYNLVKMFLLQSGNFYDKL